MDIKERYLQSIYRWYPDFVAHNVKLVEHGQNNDILIINDEFIFRFPKYAAGVQQLALEVSILQSLRETITLPMPQVAFESLSAQTVGEVFMGYCKLAGQPLWRQTFVAITDEAILTQLARQLALFLKQLHTIPVRTLATTHGLPLSDTYADCLDVYTRIRELCFPFMRAASRAWASDHFEQFLAEPDNFAYSAVLKHGDFGSSNILYSVEQQAISGIIDFGGMSLGDPAYDFAGLLSCYGEPFLRRFVAIYPEIEQFWGRIIFYQGTFALLEALFGLEHNDQQAFESGIATYR